MLYIRHYGEKAFAVGFSLNNNVSVCRHVVCVDGRSIETHSAKWCRLAAVTAGFLSSPRSRSMITWRWRHDVTNRCPALLLVVSRFYHWTMAATVFLAEGRNCISLFSLCLCGRHKHLVVTADAQFLLLIPLSHWHLCRLLPPFNKRGRF